MSDWTLGGDTDSICLVAERRGRAQARRRGGGSAVEMANGRREFLGIGTLPGYEPGEGPRQLGLSGSNESRATEEYREGWLWQRMAGAAAAVVVAGSRWRCEVAWSLAIVLLAPRTIRSCSISQRPPSSHHHSSDPDPLQPPRYRRRSRRRSRTHDKMDNELTPSFAPFFGMVRHGPDCVQPQLTARRAALHSP